MQYPQINLNGADGMDLAYQYSNAAGAIDEAIKKMMPLVHGRDYQTLPAGCFETARDEMRQRIDSLLNVRDALRLIADHCAKNA